MRAHKKKGRPLRGDTKRVRVSFTLHPRTLGWLRDEARERSLSRSEILDDVIKTMLGHGFAIDIPSAEIARVCQKHRVKKLSLFGSVLTDQFTPESDVDVLVEFGNEQGTPGFFEMAQLQSDLSEIFGGRRVDLKTPAELSRYFRDQVLKEAEQIYAA